MIPRSPFCTFRMEFGEEEPSTSLSDIWETREDNELSISELVEQAANEFVSEQTFPGYIYYEEYRMYYNHELGYYYDPKTTLFYHVGSQRYYYYDTESQSYQLHPHQATNSAPNWSQKRFQKRAVKIFGSTIVSKFSESEVDVAELLFAMTEKCSTFTRTDHKKRPFAATLNKSTLDKDSLFLEEVLSKEGRLYIGANNAKKEFGNDDTESDYSEDEDHEAKRELERRLAEEEASRHAPCIRLIEYSEGNLQPTLHIVTITGAKIGFESDVDIRLSLSDDLLSNPLISENLPSFSIRYKMEESEDGTFEHLYELNFVNSCPIAEFYLNHEKAPADVLKYQLLHEDLVSICFYSADSIRTFSFSVHIHSGLNTCAGCEPGLFNANSSAIASTGEEPDPAVRRRNRESDRRRIMRQIKDSYGLLEKDDECDEAKRSYLDRARQRRKVHGHNSSEMSANNSVEKSGIYANCKAMPKSDGSVATVVLRKFARNRNELSETLLAANSKPIEAENKGFKLLKSMGWQEGKGLGKNQQGVQGPVQLMSKSSFGQSNEAPKIPAISDIAEKYLDPRRRAILEKTKQRYEQASSPK